MSRLGGKAEPVAQGPLIVYVGANLPSRSQTFVYQEILGLRALGARVAPVSLRANPFMTRVEAELGGVHAVIGPGLAADALRALMRSPAPVARLVAALAREPVPSARQRARTAFHVVLGLALGAHARRIGAGYIHAHHAESPTTVAMVAARVAGVPFGFTAHGSDVHTHPLLLAPKIRAASVVVAASDFIRAALVEWAPQEAAKVRVVRCPVPLDRFPAPAERASSGPLRLLHVGRLDEVKDQPTLIAAMALAAARGLDFELRIVGEGPRRRELEEAIATTGLADRVQLLGGMVNDQVVPLYQWAQAFVMSSRIEGLPVVLVEALSAGLPVVATDVGGISELVREGVEGFLVPPGDPGALAEAVMRLDDVERRRALGRSGAERARVHDLYEVARRLLSLFPVPSPVPAVSTAPAGVTARSGLPSIGGPLPVSVVLAGGDEDAGLERALASAVAQRPRPPAEVIVVARGSAPAAEALAERYGAVLVREGAGGAVGHGAGARAASHPWIAPLHPDDEWLPHHLATLWELRDGHALVAGSVIQPGPHRGADRLLRRAGPGATAVRALPGSSGPRPSLAASRAALVSRAVLGGPAPQGGGGRGREHGAQPTAILTSRAVSLQHSVDHRSAVGAPRGLAAALGRVVRRRAGGRVARDGGPSVALMPCSPGEREAALGLLDGRPVLDLTASSAARACLRIAARPPAMAVAGSRLDALVLALLRVRRLHADRGEAQTRGSRRRPADGADGGGR